MMEVNLILGADDFGGAYWLIGGLLANFHHISISHKKGEKLE